MGTEDEGHDFGPAGHGSFEADNIAELIDHEWLSNGTGLGGERTRELIKAICDGDIFHNVALVQDVSAGGRNVHVNQVGRGGGGFCVVGHAFQERANL